MSYKPNIVEKLFRAAVLGLIPSTLVILLYINFFLRGLRGLDNESKVQAGFRFFVEFEVLSLVWFLIYILSTVIGFRYGWEGYVSIFRWLARALEKIASAFVSGAPRKIKGEITPAERVKIIHNKQSHQDSR